MSELLVTVSASGGARFWDVTEPDAQALDSRTRRTVVPHPQRWRTPQDAGWSDRPATARRTPVALTDPNGVADRELVGQSVGLTAPSQEVLGSPVGPYGTPVRRFRSYTVYASTLGDGPAWERAKRAELDVFAIRNGWASEASQIAGEVVDYRPYADRSHIFVASPTAQPDRAVGVARMIWGTSALPADEQFLATSMHRIDSEWLWMFDHVGYERVAEWASLGAVGSNLLPMFALWSGAYRFARARGVDYWVQSVVESLFNVYRDGFKTPMMKIGEREFFLGSESIPTVLPLEEIGVGQMLSWNPDLKRSLFGDYVDRRRSAGDGFDLVP